MSAQPDTEDSRPPGLYSAQLVRGFILAAVAVFAWVMEGVHAQSTNRKFGVEIAPYWMTGWGVVTVVVVWVMGRAFGDVRAAAVKAWAERPPPKELRLFMLMCWCEVHSQLSRVIFAWAAMGVLGALLMDSQTVVWAATSASVAVGVLLFPRGVGAAAMYYGTRGRSSASN